MEESELDLDLAVELVNAFTLAGTDGTLTDVRSGADVLRRLEGHELSAELSEDDLPALGKLSAELAPVFAAGTVAEAVSVLDPLLRDAVVPARLVEDAEGSGVARWGWGRDQQGMDAMRTRLLAALAAHLVRHGTKRTGVCRADPCRCVFVDRSRARTRRYCCDRCNDRAAATAYRRRQD
ncbi:CGNR zinc finger domain-containing protein [Streptomyces bathyalis]|uniref:CGNR zinc finger domain-containing protein n=1 Tax=Streptomyces bathyalis TaxID=2710756 RepID=A0A7T1WSD0_9ACTN|nr:CGNR zinc finger domain-containing protein [Streptomyces bathyalis]QPP07479.1 CGNR zinc finger domain-containing protein [Streptomyces bathyalis]